MKIDEIKSVLKSKYNFTDEELDNMKGKSKLEEVLKDSVDAEKTLNVVLPGETKENAVEKEIPEIGSIEWSDYVMSQFAKDELENGHPKTDGLRRMARKLLGPFDTISDVKDCPNIQNGYRAVVVVSLHFHQQGVYVNGSADVYSGNTKEEYAIHAVATAETRAEGRALRKALLLSKVLAAEELHGPAVGEPNGNDNRIISSMLNGLRIICDRQDIDIMKLANFMNYEVDVLENLTRNQGLNMSEKLAEFQLGKAVIPDNIKR